MKRWYDFEKKMTKYLQEMLYDYNVVVKQYGKADSTIPDIEVTINSNNKKFYIETKMPTSQTSQFVVEIKDEQFVYGSKNKFNSNKYSDAIITELNNNFHLYKNVSQAGIIVSIPECIAFGWIAENMKNKNVEFIISIDNNGNEKIFSVDQFNMFFNIKTILRRKKSGSQSLPKKYYDDFKQLIKNNFENYKYEFYQKNGKLFLCLPLELSKSECYISSNKLSNEKKYFLSDKGNGIYEVKLTSSTNNPNIIFELSVKNGGDFDQFTIQCLIDYINNNQ